MRERREPLYFFPVLTLEKERLLDAARARHLELVAWPIRTPIYPVESESALPRYAYMPGSCPRAEELARCLVGLPTDFGAQERERKALIELLRVHDAQCR